VGVTSAYIAGVTSGSLTVALKAGVIAAGTALAFQAVGDITGGNPLFGDPRLVLNVAGHALVGCASAAASGGKCGQGALSAAVSAFAGPIINGQGFSIGSLLLNTTLGGLASIAGGGKFANGAVTSAFGYLANSAGHSATDPKGATGGDTAYTPPEGTEVACPWCLAIEGIVLGFHAAAVVYDAVVQDSITRGQEGEAAVRAAEDIGDKTSIQINGRTRVPDGLTNTTLTEIKNVRVQYFTQQLRDFSDYAQQNNLRFDLYTRPDTYLSGPLQNAINAGRINLKTIPQ